MADRPNLSVMVATSRGWPAVRLPIDALREQVKQASGEIVVVDGSGRPAPDADDLGPEATWISRPGQSVFQLRAGGYELCRGLIVAVTEDHCVPAADWCDRILAAHAAYPEAIAIGGAVDNGTPEHLIDWAAFIVTQGPFVRPLVNGPVDRIGSVATISFKRSALERLPAHGSLGAIELFDAGEMRQPGDLLVSDDSITVSHHQSLGVFGSAAAQFHNGRTIAGFRRQTMTRDDWMRLTAFPLITWYRAIRSIRIAWHKSIPRRVVVVTVPMVGFLQVCQSAGEVIGYLRGPGSSPRHLL